MNVDDTMIAYLENLSKLQLADTEKEVLIAGLSSIIECFDLIAAVDTQAETVPMRNALPALDFRADQIQAFPNPKQLLQLAPSIQDGYITVPSTMEEA